MSQDLADARLLTVDGYGHTALANPSSCVNAAEDSYFATGALRPPGTVCHQDTLPFASDTGPSLSERCGADKRLHTSIATRDALAVTVVIADEEYFRRTAIPNKKWSPDGGASLETFFVNGCLLHFATAVRSWRKERPEWAITPGTGLASEETTDAVADP
jgi:hypothetical protein